DELGLQPNAALWFFDPEANEWYLLFAAPEVTTKGPREVYAKIREVIEQLGEKASAAPFSVVSLLDPNDELVRLLQGAVRTGPGINRVRFSKNVINGHFIDDALIYRIA
ncbi:MAG: hypothetical protein HY718_11725, partial [Planctomycetes bacterium]|nr:hypothetical protein [Planctomycetota bacterium]